MLTESRRRALAIALPLLYAAAIFVQSSFALPELPRRPPEGFDKFLHLLEYGVLGFLVQRGIALGLRRPETTWLVAAAASALYGGTDELHQSFVPGRTADWLDFAADVVGSLLGAWIGAAALSGRASRSRGAPEG